MLDLGRAIYICATTTSQPAVNNTPAGLVLALSKGSTQNFQTGRWDSLFLA